MTAMTEDGLFIGLLIVAMFFILYGHKRRNPLVSLATFIVWFGLGSWLFLSSSAPIGFGETWKDILGWFFMVVAVFIPLLFHMDVEIRHEAKGKSWTGYGSPPSQKGPSGYESYRDLLYGRTRKGR